MNIQQEVCLCLALNHYNLGSDNIELLSSLPARRAPPPNLSPAKISQMTQKTTRELLQSLLKLRACQ